MKKIVRQILCTLLTFALVWVGLPLSGFAADVGSLGQITTDSTAELVTDESREPLFLLAEDTDSRSENTKVFFASDGSKTMVLYPSPVHYLEDGVYREIDNTLAVQNGRLTTTASRASISFPTSLTASAPVTYAIGEHSISFTLQNTSTSFAAARQPEESEADVLLARAKELRESKTLSRASTETLAAAEALSKELEEELTTPHKLYSGADYENVFANTDLSFSLVGTTLKENLVFSALPAETSYTYRLETTLRAEVQESGAVLFYADDEPVIELAAPYLFDAAGEKNFDVSVTLSSVRDGYSYTVTPSRAWLADPARVYPVTLDPSFLEYNINNVKDNYAVTDLGGTSTATFNSIVSSLNASKSEIGAGRYTSTVKVGALIYADLLTQLQNDSPNARIVEARLHVAQTNTSCGVGRVVQAHKVTSDWNTATVSEDVVMAGDAAPTYESRVLDYYTTPSAVTEYSVLDITRAVQEWSTGHSENYGIYLDVADTDSTSSLVYWFSSDAINGPVFYVNYRDAMGVEDYWTYSSVSAGRYGTAAVNNFSGNLVSLQTVCATDGLRMPVELSLVYNSGVRTEAKFTKAGIGWKFNLELLLCTTEGDLAEDYPYYLLDADGTRHYFTKKSGTTEKWVDEDGLGLTLSYKRNSETNSISYFVLTAKDGTKTEFYYPGGRVYRILDPEDNYIQVNYSSNPIRISSVRDGANRRYNFTYNSADRVSKITDPAGREYTFTYSGTKLASITYPDSVKTEFSYYASTASAPNLLKTVKNPDGGKVSVSYAGEFSQVSTFACLDSDGTQMSSLSFNYASPNRTVITDADNRKTEYQFNSFGQTVNVLAPAEGAARYYEYGASGGEKNKVTLSSKLQTPTVNFVTNHGFYPSLSGWTEETVGTTVAGESTYSTLKHLDARSLYIKKTDSGGATVIARKYTVGDLPAGAGYYTFSAYVKTEGLTAHATGGGAQLVLTYNDADGNRVSKRSASLTGTGADWTRLCVTQNIPSGASGIVLRLRILGADGIARFDSVQFEKGEVANRVNLLYNHSMEDVTDTVPTKWTTSETTSADYATVTQKYKGSRSYRITGAPGVNKNLQQSVYIQGSEGDSFVFGAFAKAASRKNTGISGRWASFSIVLEFYNGDDFLEQKKVDFNFGSTDWQKLSAVFVANHDYTRLTYYLTYYKNVNAVYFDATELYRETFGQSYKYDENGNVVSVSDLAEKESTFEYSGANELVKQNNPTGTKYEYTYGSEHKHRLVSATAAGVTTTYSYGSFGNATKAKTKGNSDAYFEATSEYTSNGNYQTSSTDTLGNTTAYSYNTTKGTLTSVTDPKGNVTSYTYNASTNAPLTVTQGQSTVSYTYAADRLSTISTESSTYTFTYDEAGNTKQIKVGDRTLVTNTYDLSKGTLTRSAYGNGATVSYTYDSFDRVTREKHGSTTVAEYVYDNSGNLAILKDKLNGTETRYVYDLADRLVRMEDSAGLTVTYEYDDAGRQHKLSYTVGGETVTQEMTYGEGDTADRPSGLKINNVPIKSYTYDSLNRVTKTTLNTTAPVETTYGYLDHPTIANRTSSVVDTVKVGANPEYRFEYDANGNVTAEYEGNTLRYTYTYDAKNQLTGFTNSYPYGYSSGSFSYDENGNILQKTLDDVTATYTYADSSWGDLLTAYNGNAITYDAIGNPLTYYDGSTFTWQNGRQLASAVVDGKNISFEYNADGMRSAKVVDGVRTEYFYSDGLLLRETQTDAEGDLVYTVSFTYDESGRPFSAKYNGNTYYYVYDIYGNVKYLYDAAGNLALEYAYRDPWGGDASYTVGTSGNTTAHTQIAELNPFTYKGYYYDADLQMYYCGSRYYDPETCRFISADTIAVISATPEAVTDKNLFAYCDNNPVMRIDVGGEFWVMVGALVGAAVSAVSTGVTSFIASGGKSVDWGAVGLSALSGAASGALASTGVGVIGMITGNAAISMVENTASQVIENEGFNNFDVGEMLIDGAFGAASGAIAGPDIDAKHMAKLGKQTAKRVSNAFSNKGLREGLEETGKALSYYGKSTLKNYKKLLSGVPKEVIVSIGADVVYSNMQYRYRRLMEK